MKKLFTLLASVLLVSNAITAQISEGGQPLSFHNSELLADENVPVIQLEQVDMARLEQEDIASEIADEIPRYGVHINLNVNTTNAGEWTTLPSGDRVWKLKLTSPGALAISLLYSGFEIPKGGKLFIYNADRSYWIGSFDRNNNSDGGNYATSLVFGESIILEYFEPKSKQGQGVLQIEKLVHAYRYIYNDTDENRGGSQSCEVDINCSPEGNSWQDEKKGVVRMSVVSSQGSGWCTASMVNNTSLDCTPYILSAMHCTENSNASNFNQYTFYFNYESSGCGSGSAPQNQTIVGCTRRADSGDGGGSSGSDFALLEANSTVPSGYDAYYNGWNAQSSASANGVSIHHPAGDRKKISTYTSPLSTTGWGISNTHWSVNWAGTANGHGVTEGGSSGSPIFDNQGRIVGTLTGGGSFCSQVPNPSTDAYGKMSYHWGSNPGDNLSDWLDPGNTGQMTLAGTYAPCTPAVSLDAGITAIVSPSSSICATEITPVVTLQNFGSTTLTSVQIQYNIDGGANQTFSWTGSLSMNQTVNVTLPTMTVGAGNHTFNANTNAPNGGTDGENNNNSSSASFSVVSANSFVTLILNTDDYGSETTWELSQGGSVLYSGGPYDNNIQLIEDLCVAEGECYAFTIFDAEDDGICCGFGTGSYSLGDAESISIVTGAAFGTSETTQFCVPVAQAGCDTIVPPNFANASGFFLYPSTSSGYISGTNNFGDLGKAQVFVNTQPATIYGAVFWGGAKDWASANANSNLTVNVRQLNGAGTDLSGAVNNAPGTILQSATVALERVDTSGFFNYVEFGSPVSVNGNYAIELNFSSLSGADQFGVVTNADGDANGSDLSWELWSNDEWHSINEAWDNSSDGDFDLGIFPVVCSSLVSVDESEFNIDLGVYPNPNSGILNVTHAAQNLTDPKLEVFNSFGQLIASKSLITNAGLSTFDLTDHVSGVYLIRLTSKEGVKTTRFILK